tara:strand:+ start:606 stop:863 length:258 start_codon:yes stop_codon:yes gene_type:complete
MANFGTVEREVTFTLGENRIKFFTCMIEYSYDSGDYYTPADEDYNITSDITDEEGNIVTDLVDRYEVFTGVDINEIAYEEFKELN